MVGDSWGMRPPHMKDNVWAVISGCLLQPHTKHLIHFALRDLADNFIFQPEAEENWETSVLKLILTN